MNSANLLEPACVARTRSASGAPARPNEWQAERMPARPQPPLLRLYDESGPAAKLIGTTCFFRNRPLLRTLLEQIDPAQAEVSVLVHACSIGADVYSLCIAWELFFQGRPHPTLRCFATDLSHEFLGRARHGVYPAEILEGLADGERAYFDRVDAVTCRVTKSVRDHVEFLPASSYVTFDSSRSYDVVVLLNSLLYVSAPDQSRTLDRIATYNARHLLVTGYHADSIQRDLERNHYAPVTDRFEEIYENWTCRRSLEPGVMIEGVTFHTPAMEALRPCDDYHFRFGSLFEKQDSCGIELGREPAEAKPKTALSVALFNDTGKVAHVGCRGVSLGHDKMLSRLGIEVRQRSFLGDWSDLWRGDRSASLKAFHASELPRLLSEVGAVVVNGEGTIHHGHGLHLLTILAGAQELGLPTFLVNAVFQECDQFTDVLCKLDDFTVRDARSSAYLKRLGVPHRVVFDSILEAEFDAEPAHDFSGKIVITDWHPVRAGDVGAPLLHLLAELREEAVYYPLEGAARESDWRHAIADLRTARLVVTGRHHGVCLAGLAGVPFVALGSNTWKIEGLLELLPGNLRVCTHPNELRTACDYALANPALFADVQRFLQAQRPLGTFQKLADTSLARRAPSVATPEVTPVSHEEKHFAEQLAGFFGSGKVLLVDWFDDASARVAPQHFDTLEVAPANVNTEALRPRLPVKDGAYDTVVNLASLTRVSDAALPGWLAELHRVTGRNLWVALEAVSPRTLSWWQARFAAAGFCAHARLAELAAEPPPADGLGPVTLVLEKTAPAPGPRATITTSAQVTTVCLATNYLLMTPGTRQMWDDLGARLAEQGCQLVLLSTTEPEQALPFPVLRHPYLLRDFATSFPGVAARAGLTATPRELEWIKADISRVPGGYPLSDALAGLAAFRAYHRELLQTLQPGFLLIADNTLAQTALLQGVCLDAGFPVQIYERGLLPETLMLESRGIQAWSDMRTHWLAQDLPASANDAAAYERIRSYYLARKPQKYAQADFAGGGAEIRRQLGLIGKRVVVFLGGGYEANGHAPKGGRYEKHFYTGFSTTQEALMGLWREIEKTPNVALVFKPHPLDPDSYAIARIEGVHVIRDLNVHALIDAADVVAAQYTTLQFEAALYDKPLLLLARSAWWGRNAGYEVGSREDLSGKLAAAIARRDWQARQTNARAFNTWMMDQVLIGCTAEVPARRNLRDLAKFIARNSIDSRSLPSAESRWQQTRDALDQLRSLKP